MSQFFFCTGLYQPTAQILGKIFTKFIFLFTNCLGAQTKKSKTSRGIVPLKEDLKMNQNILPKFWRLVDVYHLRYNLIARLV